MKGLPVWIAAVGFGCVVLASLSSVATGGPLSNDPTPLAVCQDSIRIAAVRLAAEARRGLGACLTRGIECVVGAPEESAACCARAAERCDRDFTKVEQARRKFRTQVAHRRCSDVPFEDVLAGLGYDGVASRCAGLPRAEGLIAEGLHDLESLAACLDQLVVSGTACPIGTAELPRGAEALTCLNLAEEFAAVAATDLETCAAGPGPSPSASPEATATPEAEPTSTPLAATATATVAPSPNPTASATPLATASPTIAPTNSITPTAAPATATRTQTPLPSATATALSSPTRTVTPSPSATTVLSTATRTATAAPTTTITASPGATIVPTTTPVATSTATRTATATPVATGTATATPVLTATAVTTSTPVPTTTQTPVPVATSTITAIPSTPIATSTVVAPTVQVTASLTAIPSATRTGTPAPTITATPTGPFCGNGKKEAGEDCDDGNNFDCDECPSNCKTAPADCTPAGTTRAPQPIRVIPPEGAQMTSGVVCLKYPTGVVGLPGTGLVTQRVSGFQGTTTVNDFNNAAIVSFLGRIALSEVNLTVSFDLCAGATAPLPTAFSCRTVSATNAGASLPASQVQCTPVSATP